MSEKLTLITGRTRDQAIGLHKGKTSEAYRRATTLVEMNPDDMAHRGIEETGCVLLRTAVGEAEFRVQAGRLPSGLVFVPMGAAVNKIVGTETEGTGMPHFKGLLVEVEPS